MRLLLLLFIVITTAVTASECHHYGQDPPKSCSLKEFAETVARSTAFRRLGIPILVCLVLVTVLAVSLCLVMRFCPRPIPKKKSHSCDRCAEMDTVGVNTVSETVFNYNSILPSAPYGEDLNEGERTGKISSFSTEYAANGKRVRKCGTKCYCLSSCVHP